MKMQSLNFHIRKILAYPKECLLADYRIFKSIDISSYAQKCAYLIGNYELLNIESIQSNKSSRLAWDMRMNTVLTTSRYLSSILDIDSLLEKILGSTLELLGAQMGILFLYRNVSEIEDISIFCRIRLYQYSFEYVHPYLCCKKYSFDN